MTPRRPSAAAIRARPPRLTASDHAAGHWLGAAWGEAWHDDQAFGDLVFRRADGAVVHPEYATRLFGRLTKAAGVRPVRLHDLGTAPRA